uniref:Receptor protein kinase n=1 Tax=Solanum tuberosum TaxID=4113 RepID=M0ZUA4_SOLTU
MGGRWNTYGFKLSYLALLIILYHVHECSSLNSEGLRSKVDCDPYGILANWNLDHCDPCMWFGVQCLAGKVQMLDLHGNSLEGTLAPELGNLTHLRSMLIRNNNLEGKIPFEIGKLRLLSKLQFDEALTPAAGGTCCLNRKFAHCICHGSLIPLKTVDSFIRPLKGTLVRYFTLFSRQLGSGSLDNQIGYSSDNLPTVFLVYRSRAAKPIGPWKTGLSGQLQKAFVIGVPKLNRSELETACEDFSNIISSHDAYIIYKGTLSSGVEIVVASTTLTSLEDWSESSEIAFRKKIDTLSRVNHKNFVNLIGYCKEDEPFTRMMVFDYAPNGTLSVHLHETDPLEWSARMRAIMGTAYCLQYMHDLNPPVPHSSLDSNAIFLTDDYAAKITEIGFWSELIAKSKDSRDDLENSELSALADLETNIYSFGILLLEIISGKSPYSEEQGSLLNWAEQYLKDKMNVSSLVDPTLKSFKNNELMAIYVVIEECLQENIRKRPTITEVIAKLREAIDISPDAAVPRLSPLWWAELELLSSEAA